MGKSTLFNTLTGLKQHTGNWTGKTVAAASGKRRHNGVEFNLVDLPGTYSIISNSAEEEAARDFICFGGADGVVVVADATALERNLILALQIMEITPNVILCVNLIDEARRKKISIDCEKLSKTLGIPVVSTAAFDKKEALKVLDAAGKLPVRGEIYKVIYNEAIEAAIVRLLPELEHAADKINPRFAALKILGGETKIISGIAEFVGFDINALQDAVSEAKEILSNAGIASAELTKNIVCGIVESAERIAFETVAYADADYIARGRGIDKILTSRLFGIPIMLALLGAVFFITIQLANYPSDLLAFIFGWLEKQLNSFFEYIHTPHFIQAPIMDGVYKTTAWVVAVMLPPMAIFFPLFTLLEDLGYLPRVAFNLDNAFKKCGCSGKQSLCMCMGFGCNAAGVIGARIIDSPRERAIAVITNNFVPCNGRFPTLIVISSIFIGGAVANPFLGGLASVAAVTFVVFVGIAATFLVSKFLSKTFLKGLPSSFALELPPYRRPRIGKILWRSLWDRTVFVLWRAVKVAAPAGLLIWCLANIQAGGNPLIYYINGVFEPLGRLMGLDGSILTAFVLGFPANEIVIPITLMSYTSGSSLTDFAGVSELGAILKASGWNAVTGISMLIFTLFHYPCATTCLTIKKETGSLKCTLLAMLLPTIIGIAACILFNAAINLIMFIF